MENTATNQVSLADLFRIFFLAGLTFGGGLAIVTVLQRELIENRKAIARDQFLTYYALARVVPTGTQTALAVILGNHFAGIRGSIAAMAGVLTPVFVTTLALTIAFTLLRSTSAAQVLPQTVLPAAVALVAVGAISLSKGAFGVNRETALAVAAFLAAALLHLAPGLVLLLGGLVGVAIFWKSEEKK